MFAGQTVQRGCPCSSDEHPAAELLHEARRQELHVGETVAMRLRGEPGELGVEVGVATDQGCLELLAAASEDPVKHLQRGVGDARLVPAQGRGWHTQLRGQGPLAEQRLLPSLTEQAADVHRLTVARSLSRGQPDCRSCGQLAGVGTADRRVLQDRAISMESCAVWQHPLARCAAPGATRQGEGTGRGAQPWPARPRRIARTARARTAELGYLSSRDSRRSASGAPPV